MTDTDLVQQIKHALEAEEFASDAIRQVREILAPVVPPGGLPDFDFESASESERWAYDSGREDGHQEGYDEAVNDAIDRPEVFTARLREIRP
jgi:hypothetical protein